ncbi:MAG: shikimate kinase [Candidatus Cloacimonas sp.]|nr:shikimate kinase [Candidatus Cloacimonadota bacterium]
MKIYLIGFMGAGKSYLGKLLAERLSLPFFDFDTLIEQKTKRSITDIFKISGEETFRDYETELLTQLNEYGVIATGGGIIERAENRVLLKNRAHITVWLNTEWHTIQRRLSLPQQTQSIRPKVDQLSTTELYELWRRRLPLYEEVADLTNTDGMIENLESQILELHKAHL